MIRVLREILKDQRLIAAACYTGISKMLRTSCFPILPKVLIDKGIPPNKWFEGVYLSVPGLSASLVERSLKVNLKDGIRMMRDRGFPCEELKGQKEIPSYIKEILRWDQIELPMLKELGLIWYIDVLLDVNEISEEQRVTEMIEAANILNIDLDKLESEVLSYAKRLESDKDNILTRAGERQPVIRWSDVIRCP